MQIPLKMPDMTRTQGNMFIQRPVVGDASNTFLGGALVTITAGALILVATGGVLVYGQVPDNSQPPGQILPVAFFGENHWVFSPLDSEIEMNIAALSANAPVIGASAKTLADVVVGTTYGIATATSGTYAGMQFLDPTNTSNLLLQVTGIVDGMLAGDFNPRVRCKVLPACVQN